MSTSTTKPQDSHNTPDIQSCISCRKYNIKCTGILKNRTSCRECLRRDVKCLISEEPPTSPRQDTEELPTGTKGKSPAKAKPEIKGKSFDAEGLVLRDEIPRELVSKSGDDFPTLPGDAGVLETDAAFGLDPHSGDTHTAIESDSEPIAINFSSQADPFDYSTLTFSPPHGPKTFLAKGSVADIWMVDHTSACARHGTAYVSKLLRVSTSDFDNYSMLYEYQTAQDAAGPTSWRQFIKSYRKQVAEWSSLGAGDGHENVIKVFNHRESLNLHVEYCHYGSVREYLRMKPSGMTSKNDIIYDLVKGLDYLHSRRPPIVHGSLNAGKLFVDKNHQVKIGEFGLTALCYQTVPYLRSVTFSGFSRWMSPELLDIDPDGEDYLEPTQQSDIWALGCTVYEIAVEELPFSKYKHDIRIQRAILEGELPGDPNTPSRGEEIPDMNIVLDMCWSIEPAKRPTANALLTSDATAYTQ